MGLISDSGRDFAGDDDIVDLLMRSGCTLDVVSDGRIEQGQDG